MARIKRIMIMAFCLFAGLIVFPKTVNAEDELKQTDYYTTTADISWSTPESSMYGEIQWFKIEWGQKGKYTESDTVKSTVRKYKIKRLEPGSTYNVKLSFKYLAEIAGEYNYHEVEYGTATIYTLPANTSAPDSWKYTWHGNTLGISPIISGSYQVIIQEGGKAKNLPSNSSGGMSYGFAKNKLVFFNSSNKWGVATVSLRQTRQILNEEGLYCKTLYGNWSSKTVVAEPMFSAKCNIKKRTMTVTISPVKTAYAYEVYLSIFTKPSKYPGISGIYPGMKGTQKVATVSAKSGKKVKVTVKKYNKHKLDFHNHYVLQVVTRSSYGKSSRYGYQVY